MSVQATPQVSAQEEGFKVFVGNLSFATKEDALTEMFSKVGPISGAVIINRGARSLGYGFVTFVNEADANTAITTCDKADISGRQINVELAKPPTVQTPRAPRVAAEPREPRVPVIGADGVEVAARKRKPRNKPTRGGAKGGRRPRTDGETEEAGDAPTESLSAALAATTLEPKEGETPAPRGGRPPKAPRAPRAPLVRRGTPTGLASTTLLFAANLPFSVDDAALLGLFEGYKVLTARVVVKKYGPGEGRSKGFGFVDFESEEEQKRALENVNGKEIDGREITLKIAIDHAEEVAPVADAAAPVVA